MIRSIPFAHAGAFLMAGFYLLCVTLSYIAPEFLFSIAQSWVHSLNLEVLRDMSPISPGSAVTGFLTSTGATWIVAYVFAETYNKLSGKNR
ncbi:MAG TPA: DUF5676 family membrane protein [Patescibacteria group bacterium]|nr:DUF5676 family membrane protein [Patescibacteria group bacterium]